MKDEARRHLLRFAERYREAAPEGWVRIVTWWAKLGDSPQTASLDALATPGEVIVRRTDGSLHQQPIEAASEPLQDLLQLEALEAGEPEEGWLVMRMEIDHDDPEPRVTFDHETLVRAETSLQDPWAQEVHLYLERHRDELEQLASGSGGPRRQRWSWFRDS